MSRWQIFSKKLFQLLNTKLRLTQYLRHKTTSEHVMKLRSQFAHFKTQQQIAMETKAHMNFMPIPEGGWREYQDMRNMKWSRMLYSSISALGITIYCMYWMDTTYLHTLPPQRKLIPDPEKTGKLHL